MMVLLNTLTKVNEFVKTVRAFESDVDLGAGSYIADAKSILGVISLDLSKPVEVTIISNDEEEIKKFEKEMARFEP